MIDIMYATAKVKGGKKFKAMHPLVEEARAMNMRATRLEMFEETIANGGKKPNPLASLPGARREKDKFVPGVTKPDG